MLKLHLSRALLVMLTGAASAAWSAPEPVRVAPVSPGVPAPVQPKAPMRPPAAAQSSVTLGTAGAVTAKPGSANVQGVTSAAVALTLSELGAGTLTAKEAWKRGALTPLQMAHELDKQAVYEGSTPELGRLRSALLGLLIEHGQSLWEPLLSTAKAGALMPANLPAGERWLLALGDALGGRGDERAVAVFEGMLARMGRWGLPTQARHVPALDHLGGYYKQRGDLKKALETFERGEKYSTHPNWMAVVHLELARLHTQLGNAQKAQGLYAKVLTSGDGWFSGLAVWDRANALVQQGKHAEARVLLQKPVKGSSADAARVGMLSLLALSYFRTGEKEEARRLAQEALAQRNALKTSRWNIELEPQVRQAKRILERLAQPEDAGRSAKR